MKSIKPFILGLSLLFAAACTKDTINDPSINIKIPEPISNCTYDFTEAAVNIDTLFGFVCPYNPDKIYPNRYVYEHPVFNPNNMNEIAYLRNDTEDFTNIYELFTFNFCTGETKKLTSNSFYGLDWSSKGWLIYTGYDLQIHKIKSNGEDQTQLTFDGVNNHPKWNDEGTAFVYEGNEGYKIADEDGVILHELNFGLSGYSWRGDYITYSCDDENACVGLLNGKTLERTIATQKPGWPRRAHTSFYLEETNETLWVGGGIGIADIESGVNHTFVEPANTSNRLFVLKDAIYDKKNDKYLLLKGRTNITKVHDCLKEIDTAIYLMDENGENERRVLIPEPE